MTRSEEVDRWEKERDRSMLWWGAFIKKPINVDIRTSVQGRPELKPFVAVRRQGSSTDYWVVGGVDDIDSLIQSLQTMRYLLDNYMQVHNL